MLLPFSALDSYAVAVHTEHMPTVAETDYLVQVPRILREIRDALLEGNLLKREELRNKFGTPIVDEVLSR